MIIKLNLIFQCNIFAFVEGFNYCKHHNFKKLIFIENLGEKIALASKMKSKSIEKR